MGTTLFEAAFLGTPAVVVPRTPVHARQATWLASHGFLHVAHSAGDAGRLAAGLLHDGAAVAQMSSAGRRFAHAGRVVAVAAAVVELAGPRTGAAYAVPP
jgi:spore coat polysaccharide biosynthesis predicted glycosyltransferase SpsG